MSIDFAVLMPFSRITMLECHSLFISPSPLGADISGNAPFAIDQRSLSHTTLQTQEGMCWHRDQTGHPHAVKWNFPALGFHLFHRSTVSAPRSPLIETVKEHKWDWSRPEKHSWNTTDDAPFTRGWQLDIKSWKINLQVSCLFTNVKSSTWLISTGAWNQKP